jgi:hypothetical protein
VLVDSPGEGRTYREAPEIDGIVRIPDDAPVGAFVEVVVTGADGPDLVAGFAGDRLPTVGPQVPAVSGPVR